MTWRYVAAFDGEYWTVREVYDAPRGWTAEPSLASGDTLEELKSDLQRMLHDVSDGVVLDILSGTLS
jgi:hypothetical protein